MSLDSKGVNDEYNICALALPIRDGCYSFVDCHVVWDWEGTTQQNRSVECNYLRTEYKEEWRIVKQSGVICSSNCNINLQLDTIVAHHNNCQYQIAYPTSFPSAKTGCSSEAVNDPLSKDLLQLYRDGILSDATINTEGKSFSAHRSILAARSPIFRAMFEKDEMSEGPLGVVDIDDVDSETVGRMLVFLYGDSLQGLQWGEAASLYYAADKYAVQPLKQKCADILKAGLTVDNVCDALILAHTHSDEQLMKSVVDFMHDHQ
ncbi:hypothetical protein JTE90_001888 [Oedothorax gibbosus]|uniref:BTB domain-containing protein n=1 Tax=Oedothorax gibbosus TaxID=931172 RepID=A0AAV6VQ90_9ARAC|nr:hypothetical protein JTE90_001888 [Oedothorax gibbosus]